MEVLSVKQILNIEVLFNKTSNKVLSMDYIMTFVIKSKKIFKHKKKKLKEKDFDKHCSN